MNRLEGVWRGLLDGKHRQMAELSAQANIERELQLGVRQRLGRTTAEGRDAEQRVCPKEDPKENEL